MADEHEVIDAEDVVIDDVDDADDLDAAQAEVDKAAATVDVSKVKEMTTSVRNELEAINEEMAVGKMENCINGVPLPTFIFQRFVNRLDPIEYCQNVLRDHYPEEKRYLHSNQIEFIRAACNPKVRRTAALMARQCLVKGTVIHTRDGGLLRIEDHPAAWHTRKDAPVLEIHAHGGHVVTCTENHPIFTPDGWKQAADFHVGDKVVCMYAWSKWSDRYAVISMDACELMGMFSAVTHVSIVEDNTLRVVCNSKAVMNRLKHLVRAVCTDVVMHHSARSQGVLHVPMDNTLATLVEMFGKPGQVNVNVVGELSKAQTCAYLHGVYNMTATVATLRRKYITYNADANMGTNKLQADVVRELLLKLGVRARVKPACGKWYIVRFKGERNRRVFIDNIGVPLGRKFPKCDDVKKMKFITGEDGEQLYVSRVTSIKPAGTADVYDVEYPGKGWFIAGGIKVHNSGKTESVASICGYLCDNYPQMRVGVFTPRLQQAETDIGRMSMFYQMNENLLNNQIVSLNKDKVELSNKSYAMAVSASDQSNIEGYTFDVIILDEAQKVSNYTWSERITPMGGATNAKLIKVGTPKTRNHFYDCVEGRAASSWKVFRRDWTQCPQLWALDSTMLPDKDTGELRPYSTFVLAQMPKALKQWYFPNNPETWTEGSMDIIDFRTQYMLEFVDGAGTYLSKDQVEALGKGEFDWLEKGVIGEKYVAGIDFAGSNPDGDATHVTVLRVNPDGSKHKVFAKEFNDTPYPQQMYEIARLFGGYTPVFQVSKIFADYTGCGAAVVQTLRDEYGLSMMEGIIFNQTDRFTHSGMNMKNIMYAKFLQALDGGKFVYPSLERFTASELPSAGKMNTGFYHKMIGEWADLEVITGYTVNKKIQAPKGYHDDVCDADVLANFTTVAASQSRMPRPAFARVRW